MPDSNAVQPTDLVSLIRISPERRLVAPEGGSLRHISFNLQVAPATPGDATARPKLRLALVVDRSGSMSGAKLQTAKLAALAVLDRLTAQDEAVVVVFDHEVQVLQPLGPVTDLYRMQARLALGELAPGGNTALHEGWLTGCLAIARETAAISGGEIARCFLLTDGQANHGITDAEQIATQVHDVRNQASVSTSTFGIGDDYMEDLLGAMAVAGGGQFHHLRTVDEIANTFVAELGELLTIAAPRVRLEVAAPHRGVRAETISHYQTQNLADGQTGWVVDIGDLIHDEERQVVMRFRFPVGSEGESMTLRARMLWERGGVPCAGDWQDIVFTYAYLPQRSAEPFSRTALHWAGLHHGYRTRVMATRMNREGNLEGARRLLLSCASRIESYEGEDMDLQTMRRELQALAARMGTERLSSMALKEQLSSSQRLSRGQRDLR